MKIHIIGGSGTGKSYLANTLASKYNINHYDLDDLQWDNSANEYGVKMDVQKRSKLLQDILNEDNWIIEGVYYSWCSKCFEEADVIYVLEIPLRICKYRIIRRFIKRKLGLEKGKKESLKSFIDLLKWTEKFQKVNIKEIKNILKQYNNKVVYIKSSRELKKLYENKL